MAGFVSITGTTSFTPSGSIEVGSGYYLGDDLILTAGHVFYYTNAVDARSARAFDTLSGYSASSLNLRNYENTLHSYYMNLSDPLPVNRNTPGEIKADASIRLVDTVFLSGTSNVGRSDAGVVLFLNSSDIVSSEYGLNSVGDNVRVSRSGSTTNVSDGSLSFASPGGFLVHSAYAGPGDSGGALVVEFRSGALNMGGREFILGNIHSIDVVTGTGLSSRGPSKANYFSASEFGQIMSFLGASQSGNVTSNDPTNLIVGTSGQDSAVGSYRADILLGRASDDEFTDDPVGSPAWGNDQLFGGTGDDTFFLSKGDDLAHGGDPRDYSGGRTAINDDGIDKVDYGRAPASDHITIKTNVSGNTTHQSTTDAANRILVEQAGADNGTDTLISIEKIVATAGVDTFQIEAFSAAQLAGADGKGGLAEIDFGANDKPDVEGDLVDASKVSSNLTIDLATSGGKVQVTGDTEKVVKISNAERAWGGSGTDTITGNEKNNEIVGGNGGDTLKGDDGDDVIYANVVSQNSAVLQNDNGQDTLEGGSGNDKLFAGSQDLVADVDKGDQVFLNGTRLVGGEGEKPPANPCNPADPSSVDDVDSGKFTGADGTIYEYDKAASTLTVSGGSGNLTITGFRNGDAGIVLRGKRPDQDQAECNRDPLIIDLDGDRNVVRELFDSSAYFDLDNDGFRERVAWSLSGDGFLVRDRNGNGQIDDGTELFGSGRTEFDGGVAAPKGTSGFTELTTLDSNFDGAISALDADFEALRVWVDANGDAVTDEGELKSLDELGIVSISLSTLKSDDLDCGCDGTEVTYRSSVTFAGGSSRSMYDAYLSIDQYDTREIVNDVEVPADFADLPFLIGSGILSDLDVAMARDPALEEMVRAFAALTPDQAGEIGARVEQIILRWTGADTVEADSRGTAMNARWLRAIEKVSGSDFNQARIGANPRADAASILTTEWTRLVGDVTAKLLGQTPLGQTLLPGLSYAGAAFYTAEDGATVSSILSEAVLSEPADDSGKLSYWHTVVTSLQRYTNSLGMTSEEMNTALDQVLLQQGVGLTAAELSSALFATSASGGLTIDTSQATVNGKTYASNRVLVATQGNARLVGGAGNDRYIVTDTVGSVSVVDVDGTDSLQLRGWNRSSTTAETRLLRSEFDAGAGTLTASFELILTQGDSSVQINADFRNGKLLASVENVTFEDGLFNITDLIDFDEKIVVGDAVSNFDFGTSLTDQYLMGRGASDVYRLTATSGTDIAFDEGGAASPDDVLKIDALPNEVTFVSGGADLSNLIVGIAGTGSAVTIANQFGKSGPSVEYFEFSDGSRITAAQVHLSLTTGTLGSDTLQGTGANDLFDGMGGSDVLAGGKGEDSYVFRPGYGQLVVDDLNGLSHIQIEGAVTEADLDFAIQPEGLRIAVGTGGDTILLPGNRYASGVRIELNGTALNFASQLVQKALQAGTLVNGRIDGTAGDDYLTGSSDADLIVGNGGNDFAQGGLGNDTFLVSSGKVRVSDTGFGYDRILIDSAFSLSDFEFVTAPYGDIRIRLGGTALRVDMPNQLNYTTGLAEPGGSDIEEIAFADGYTIDLTAGRILTGDAGNNVLFNYGYGATTFTPGAGDDYIFSLNGSHALQLSAGFGHDVFYSSTQGNITFSGISLDAHVSFARDGFDLVVKVADGADTLTLKNAFEPLGGFWNRTLHFAGSQITVQQVVNSIASATNGDDLLWGRTTLDGGAGNDVLIGDGSPNSYVFGRGYGNDIIKEQDGIFGNSGSSDVLTLVGLNPDDVTFARDAADPLSIVITIRDTGETLTLDGTPFDSYTYNSEDSLGDGYSTGDQSGAHWIDQIVFADGTVLTQRDIEQAVIDAERTTGADVLDNFGAPSGSFGNESGAILDGGAGDDTYVNQFDDIHVQMSAGTGSDRIVNLNPGRTRVHVSLAGIPAADILILYETREGQEVTVLHAKSGEELVIDGRPDGNNDLSIYVSDIAAGTEYIAFAEGALVDGQVATDGVDYLNGEITYQSEGPTIVFDDTFNPGKGDDVIAGLGGADTINFNPGDGSDRLLRSGLSGEFGDAPESYVISLGAGIARQDFTYSWLNDGSYNVLLSFNDQGDGITVDAREAGTLAFADGSIIQIGDFGSSSISLSPGQTVWFNEATDDIFVAEFGDVRIRIGADSGNDRFIDSSLSGPDGPLLQAPEDWEANALILEGGVSLDDFEFVKDSSAPNNLVVRNLLTGSSIVVEDQFASEALVSGQPAWRSPDLNGDGAADWATADLDGDGEIDFAGFDSDGNGSPNWTNPDFNGDGVADWERYTQLSLDTNGDGNPDVYAYDDNSDGTVDTFDVLLTPTAAQPNVYGVTFRDTNGDNVVDEYTTDYVTFTPLPVDGNGAVAWNTIDTNEDGAADIAQLDTDGDGAPNWLAPDIDGDGQSDWRDESVDELYNANGDYVGFRVFDPLTGNVLISAES